MLSTREVEKIVEFAKIWPLTCHNRVKYWSRTKNNTTNREYSARAIFWSFPRSSTTLRLETPRGVAPTPPPPPTPAKVAKHRLRARVKSSFSSSRCVPKDSLFCGPPGRNPHFAYCWPLTWPGRSQVNSKLGKVCTVATVQTFPSLDFSFFSFLEKLFQGVVFL